MLPGLCEELRPKLRRIFWHYRIGPQDAEDLLQTVLTLALMRWEEIRDPAGWLVGTLDNQCVMYWRARHRRDQRFESLTPFHDELAVAPVQERRRVLAELASLSRRELPAQQRRVLALRYGLGCSSDEVAAASGLALGSVRKTVHRALLRLRRAATTVAAPQGRKRRLPVDHLVADSAGAEGSAARAWETAVEAFLSDRAALAPETRRRHRRSLTAAGARLGFPAPEELRRAAVAEYCAGLIAEGASEGRIEAAITALRTFAKWAGERRARAVCAAEAARALPA